MGYIDYGILDTLDILLDMEKKSCSTNSPVSLTNLP